MEEFHKALRAFYGARMPNAVIHIIKRNRHEMIFPGELKTSRKTWKRRAFRSALVTFLIREGLWQTPNQEDAPEIPEEIERKSTGITPEDRKDDRKTREIEREPVKIIGTPRQILRLHEAIVEYKEKMKPKDKKQK